LFGLDGSGWVRYDERVMMAAEIAVEEDGLETAMRYPGRGSLGGCDPVHPPSAESDEGH
jgi:hypothetical protein